MKTVKNILMVAMAALALSSCVTNELVPESTTKMVSFAKKNISIAKAGDTQTVAVSANTDWNLRTDAEWVKLAPQFGTVATKSITVTVEEENNTDDVRVAQVIIVSNLDSTQSDTLTVTQSNVDGVGKIVDADTFLAFLENAASVTDGDVVEIGEDIDLGGATIAPAASFAGTLEGNGHKVYNFVVESSFSGTGFIVENRGTVQNLKVGTKDGSSWDKVSTFKFATGAEANAAGVVAINSGLMKNVYNYASVDVNVTSNASSDTGVGGIAGTFGGPNAKLENCHNYGAVSFSGTLGYRSSLGGVLGFTAQAGTQVTGCVNHADLNQATKNAKEYAMGGVVGRANEKLILTDCINEGSVAYTSTDAPGSYLHIAGVIGAEYKGAEISNCVNKGAISSCIAQVNRMGGIVGTMNSGGTITNCRNEASLSLEQDPNSNWQSVGGICGFEEKCTLVNDVPNGTISDCTNSGKIKVVINNATTHANQTAAGGIIGITCSYTVISGNTNNGDISMTNEAGAATRAGGIVGWDKTTATTLESNTNNAAVTVTAPAGQAGGIAGATDVAGSVVKDNTNLGTITCAACAGSIAGNAVSALTSCAVGGTVNGTVLTAGNFSSYIQGSGSGVPVACYFPGAAVKDYVSAAPVSLNFVAAGESATVTVSANCAWTAVASEIWLTLSDAEGTNDGSVIVVAAENTGKSERTATITFTSKTDATVTAVVSATQAGKVEGLAGNKITSAADFKDFLALAADAQATDTYTLEADVDMDGATLATPAAFAGVLDGKGHKIFNFSAEDGVFADNSGTIKNIVFGSSDGTVYDGKSVITSGAAPTHHGIIVVNSGTVENITNFATVKVTAASSVGNNGIGSIVGYSTAGSIANCTNYGEVVLDDKVTISQETRLGGVVGRADGAQTITNCLNKAPITVTTKTAKVIMMGGVVGVIQNKAAVSDCINDAPIAYNQVIAPGTWMAIGGVVGALYTSASIENCVNNGTVSDNLSQVVRIGGITGVMNSGGSCSGCTNNGSIELTQTTNANWQAAAGIVGFEEKGTSDAPIVIKHNTNKGEVVVSVDNATTHNNKVAAGGIIGTSCSVTEIVNNINQASVTLKNVGTAPVYAGGIAGWYRAGSSLTVSGNTNSGNVAVTATTGFAGGVIGSASVAGVTISGEKSNADISGNVAGGIAGENNGNISNCSVGGHVNGANASAANAQGTGSGTITDIIVL